MPSKKTAKKVSAKGTSKKATSKAAASKARAAAAKPSGGGFQTFAMHVNAPAQERAFNAMRASRAAHPSFALTAGADINTLDPETAAQNYLRQALDSAAVPSFTAPVADGAESEFKSLGTDTLPLTNTKTVKFRQFFNKIPVYSSLVTVELDENNQLLAINSAMGTPTGVSPIAKIAPAEALKKALAQAGTKPTPEPTPRLSYYYDDPASRWRLVYIIEDVPVKKSKEKNTSAYRMPLAMDYVIDANTGALVAELPRTPTATIEVDAKDGLGQVRHIRFSKDGAGKLTLRDEVLNLLTCDFKFRDPDVRESLLPGDVVGNPPDPWADGAVSAHANAGAVATFLRDVVKRNNIDNRGGALVSTINCVVASESPGNKVWLNAFWTPVKQQMVYGQILFNGKLRSLSVFLDVVGHEMFHGVTDATSRLEYANQSGALNESYSDIFGAIIANFTQPDIAQWNWEIGAGLGSNGKPLRDMKKPSRCGQPEKMSQFKQLPNTRNGDFGGVHTNSGIHNFAAFKLITSRNAQGFVFKPSEVAALFYIALTQQLTRRSDFSASRRAVTLAARTFFRNDPPATLAAKVKAITDAFTAVGIKEPAN